MYIYLLIYLILFILFMREILISRYTEPLKSITFLLVLLLLSVIAGIRYGIGTDYFAYLTIFQGIQNFGDYSYLEPGFRLIISFMKKIGFSELSLFFVFSFVSLSFLFRGIKKSSKFPFFSIFIFALIFYIAYTFNGIRQGVAMSLFVYLLKDIENRNLKKVILFTIIGFTIHYSAIYIIIGYFFSYFKINRKQYLIITFLCMVFVLTNNYWSGLINAISPDVVVSKIVSYSESFKEEVDFIGLLQRVLILVLLLVYYPSISKIDNSFALVFKLYFLGFIFYAIYSGNGMFATRINMFFRILEIILLPNLLQLKNNKYEKISIVFILVFWATTIFLGAMRNPYNYPFYTIFQN